MLSLTDAQKRAADSLVGFPQRIVDAYLAYANSADTLNLDIVVLGVLQFYLAKKPARPLDAMPSRLTPRMMKGMTVVASSALAARPQLAILPY